jgi:hypothetical protein
MMPIDSSFWKLLAKPAPRPNGLFSRGWYLGDEAFRQELLQAAQAQVGRSHYGVERQETAEQRARRLRAETTVTLQWIAAALAMGTWTHVANQLSHASLPA